MAPSVNLFGPLDSVLGSSLGPPDVLVIEVIILLLVLVTLVTRIVAHSRHEYQVDEEGAEGLTRFLPHEVVNVLLLVSSLYYLTIAPHAGMVMSVLVLGVFISDFFEFEARKAEARRDVPLDRPKGAIAASLLALTYAAYQVLFFVIQGPFGAIV